MPDIAWPRLINDGGQLAGFIMAAFAPGHMDPLFHVAGIVARAAERGLPVLFDAWAPWDADQPGKFMKLATLALRLCAPEPHNGIATVSTVTPKIFCYQSKIT